MMQVWIFSVSLGVCGFADSGWFVCFLVASWPWVLLLAFICSVGARLDGLLFGRCFLRLCCIGCGCLVVVVVLCRCGGCGIGFEGWFWFDVGVFWWVWRLRFGLGGLFLPWFAIVGFRGLLHVDSAEYLNGFPRRVDRGRPVLC